MQWAVVLSLLIHALALFWALPNLKIETNGEIVHGPLQISLVPKQSEQAQPEEVIVEAIKPQPVPQSKPKRKPKPPKVQPKVKQVMVKPEKLPDEVFTVPEEIADLPEPEPLPAPEVEPTPIPEPETSQAAPTDMMALIRQKREARAAQGDPSAIIALEEGKVRGQSVSKTTEQIVRDNLKQPGTNGIFSITTLNRFEGVFAFQGWRGEFSNAQMRQYRVESFSAQDDIRILMVNKMIEIIRSHYSGDFNWDSHRLGTVITLSARQKDHDKLVAFLLDEFNMQFDYFLRH